MVYLYGQGFVILARGAFSTVMIYLSSQRPVEFWNFLSYIDLKWENIFYPGYTTFTVLLTLKLFPSQDARNANGEISKEQREMISSLEEKNR